MTRTHRDIFRLNIKNVSLKLNITTFNEKMYKFVRWVGFSFQFLVCTASLKKKKYLKYKPIYESTSIIINRIQSMINDNYDEYDILSSN